MDERTFWIIVRRALLMLAKAIEARWGKDPEPNPPQPPVPSP